MSEAAKPDLAGYTPKSLSRPGPDSKDEWRHHRELINALLVWLESAPDFTGLRAAVEDLNAHGHSFVEIESRSPGWVIYRTALPDVDHELQVSATRDPDPEIMLTTPLSDAAWERELESRLAGLSDEERRLHDLQQEFYDRGSALARDEDSRAELPVKDQALLALYSLDAQVNNGGFSQYFINTGGAVAATAADALGAIGAVQTEALLRKAMALLGSPFGEELSEEQWRALDEHASELHHYDETYYKAEEDVASLTMLWIQRADS